MGRASSAPEISLTRLRIFAAVVEHRGYTAAATALAVSQATVSFHVQALERAFGARLLEYHGRQVHLTAAGEALHALARRTLGDVEQVAARIADLDRGRAGSVRLAASMAFEQSFFFDRVVAPYTRATPAVELSIRYGTSRQAVEALRAGDADLAYVLRSPTTDAGADTSLRYTPLHGSDVVFFVGEHHRLANRSHVALRDVGAAGLVTAPLDATEWAYYDRALARAGLGQYRIALRVNGVQARTLATRAGLGVLAVFWPPYAARAELPGLVQVDIEDPPVGDPATGPEFGLLERTGRPPGAPCVAGFTRWLRRSTHRRAGPARPAH